MSVMHDHTLAHMRHARGAGLILLFCFVGSVIAFGLPHVHVHVGIPHVTIGPVTLTPVGPLPTPVVKKADEATQKATDAALHAGETLGKSAASVGAKVVENSPQVQILHLISDPASVKNLPKSFINGNGQVLESVGKGISETQAATLNVPIVAADSIGGPNAKNFVTVLTGPNRLQVDFASEALIASGGTLQGKDPKLLIAAPFAAALRSAMYQFQAQAQPLPQDVLNKLKGHYPDDVLRNARWTVGAVSISVPDAVNQFRAIAYNEENAVTAGNISVFYVDPQKNYHWWAHEIWHQVQYKQWGIDKFAYNYVTGCHSVESDAETHAAQLLNVPANQLLC